MSLRRCSSGHFYDADKYEGCPYCNPQGDDDGVTVTFPAGHSGAGEGSRSPKPEVVERYLTDQPGSPQQGLKLKDVINIAIADRHSEPDDDGQTISIYGTSSRRGPVAGWLVCIEGPEFGESFTLRDGKNYIGRGNNMDICLRGDNTVSRERHAIIVYDPKKRAFLAQAGESRELYYVNDDVVLSPQKLQRYDILSIGNTRLMFFPCCDETFNWDDYRKSDRF